VSRVTNSCLSFICLRLRSSKTVDPSSQLWTTRYAPQNIKEICGNKGQVEKLQEWLKDWCVTLCVPLKPACDSFCRPKSVKSGFKKPGKNGMNVYRAVLITGPPGIGKTTSAHMVAKLEGFTPIELNASDARSKKLVEVIGWVVRASALAHDAFARMA
jgi:replication factor C subunit 1